MASQPPTASSVPHIACFISQTPVADLADGFSNLNRFLRALVHCRRLLRRGAGQPTLAIRDPITTEELNHELLTCARSRQRQIYAAEIAALERNQLVSKISQLRTLCPFLDNAGILRVGGRLDHSSLSFPERHPAILDNQSRLADLIIDWAHARALYGGFRVTYAYAMQRAWIVRGRVKIRAHLRRCVVCARATSRPLTQVMAPLPAQRVTPSRPFSRTGIDYAGPFQVLSSKGRGVRTSKGYVAVFVCLCTKAVHLELVGDLTTQSFLGALSRFSGHRGKPAELWSDNATNFRSADVELRQMLREAPICFNKIADSLASEGIKWQSIPPSAPHFGGLWEAGVKSMKRHLRRVAAPKKLTYEEFATLLVEIELVLNSRPLGPISGDLDDIHILTPAHFLIGGPLMAHPHPVAADLDLDRVTHWQLVNTMRDLFWARWGREYLNSLQQRSKWTRPRENIAIGDVVVVVDPSLLGHHGRWPLATVLATHPGPDGQVRVAKVRTASGAYTRPITRLVRLPLSEPSAPVDHDQT